MKCPSCNEYAPENNYKCPHCGEILKPDISPDDFRPKSAKPRRTSNSSLLVLLLIVVGAAILIYAAFFREKSQPGGENSENVTLALSKTADAGEVSTGKLINADNPGQEINIEEFIHPGKTTIFDFYSEYCGPCRKMAPYLKRLDSNRKDIIVNKVDINRPGSRGIDWRSPVAKQYKIASVPHFVIYDSSGKLTHQGRDAYDQVVRLINSK